MVERYKPKKTYRPTAFKPGHKRVGGRLPGVPNKLTSDVKEAIIRAGELAGNKVGDQGLISYLEHIADKRPEIYCRLLEKVLPLQVALKAPYAIMPLPQELLTRMSKEARALLKSYYEHAENKGIPTLPAPEPPTIEGEVEVVSEARYAEELGDDDEEEFGDGATRH